MDYEKEFDRVNLHLERLDNDVADIKANQLVQAEQIKVLKEMQETLKSIDQSQNDLNKSQVILSSKMDDVYRTIEESKCTTTQLQDSIGRLKAQRDKDHLQDPLSKNQNWTEWIVKSVGILLIGAVVGAVLARIGLK